jgi:hypothetical protein
VDSRPRRRRAGGWHSLARDLISGALPVADCVRRACGIWDFGDVLYPGLSGDLRELALMCWLHGDGEYEVNGGDERLLAAARALASRSR